MDDANNYLDSLFFCCFDDSYDNKNPNKRECYK